MLQIKSTFKHLWKCFYSEIKYSTCVQHWLACCCGLSVISLGILNDFIIIYINSDSLSVVDWTEDDNFQK